MFVNKIVNVWIILALFAAQDSPDPQTVLVSAGHKIDRQTLESATSLEFANCVDPSNGRVVAFVSDNDLTQLRYVRSLTSLTIRDGLISNDSIRWLETPFGFNSPKTLDLSGCTVDCHVAWHLARMPAIRTINLSRTDVGDEGLFMLQKCGAFELILEDTLITNEGVCSISSWRQLDRLNLARTIIDDVSAFHLAKISQVHHLDISHTEVTERGMLELLVNQHALRSLTLTGCNISVDAVACARQSHPRIQIIFD